MPNGQLIGLVGPSGSGKSTLLELVSGYLKLNDGRVYINEKDVTKTPVKQRDVGMVFQSNALLPDDTVREAILRSLDSLGEPQPGNPTKAKSLNKEPLVKQNNEKIISKVAQHFLSGFF